MLGIEPADSVDLSPSHNESEKSSPLKCNDHFVHKLARITSSSWQRKRPERQYRSFDQRTSTGLINPLRRTRWLCFLQTLQATGCSQRAARDHRSSRSGHFRLLPARFVRFRHVFQFNGDQFIDLNSHHFIDCHHSQHVVHYFHNDCHWNPFQRR